MKYFYKALGILLLGILLFIFVMNSVSKYVCDFSLLMYLPIVFILFPILSINFGIKAYKENVKLGGSLSVIIGILGIAFVLFFQFMFFVGAGWCSG